MKRKYLGKQVFLRTKELDQVRFTRKRSGNGLPKVLPLVLPDQDQSDGGKHGAIPGPLNLADHEA